MPDEDPQGPSLHEEAEEPLPPSQRLPAYLLRTLHHTQASHPAHLLLLAAHAAMLETGFVPGWPVPDPAPPDAVYQLPAACWVSASICRISYRLALPGGGAPAPACTLQCSVMGGGVVLAVAAQRHTRHVSLQAATFFPPPAGAEQAWAAGAMQPASLDPAGMRRLWTALKDGLAFPMLLAAYAEAGLPPPAGLLALPEDLKQSVLELLGVRCRLSPPLPCN